MITIHNLLTYDFFISIKSEYFSLHSGFYWVYLSFILPIILVVELIN